MGFVKILLRTLFLLGMGYVMLYPILFALSGAFKARVDVYDPTVIWLPKHYSMEAMNLAVKSLKFWDALKQTLIILIPSVCLQMISTLMAGPEANMKYESLFLNALNRTKSYEITGRELKLFGADGKVLMNCVQAGPGVGEDASSK